VPPRDGTGTIAVELSMSRDSILIMDPAGRIVWANRLAHDIAGLKPGGLLGLSYLQVTPPDTHAELLKLHQRKLAGETVRFRIAFGEGRILSTTSGLVHVNGRAYLFAVGRWAEGPPAGDEVLLGELAVGEMLHETRRKVDLNALLVSVLRDEARALKGRLALEPGDPPDIKVRPWPIRTVLRHLLLQTRRQRGRAAVSTGGDPKRAWIEIQLPREAEPKSAELEMCRRIARQQGGRLRVQGRVLRLTLPV
jgi:PAS domain S-box-containing protein